ncbi:Prolipoprotein diacylglyceryl transferase [hydrothermal vent metagenome]|uniref:Prolipoprotein diacylglyceryl transferase n=1 Tax=hydrothermal vent metagenome TaxID=652676 RepID=A0A3B1BUD4_9ZZZZ
MHPELLHIGPITIYTYGLLVASGFLLGITWTARMGKKEGLDSQAVYDTAFWIVVSAIIGSRVVFGIVNFDYFAKNPLDFFKLWNGGLVFYGGLIGAAVAVVICARRYNLDFWAFADAAAPGVALGHSVGRIGCFFAGCCYGIETSVPWAVTFNNVKSMAPIGVPIHPTQLYDSANEFTIFLILTAIRPWRKFKGQIWWTWVGLYAIGRSIVEMYRGDPRGVYFNGLMSTSQIIAAGAFTLAIAFYFRGVRGVKDQSHA